MENIVVDLSNKNIKSVEKGSIVTQFTNLYDKNKDVLISQLRKIPAIMSVANEIKKEELFNIVIPPGYEEKLQNGLCFLERLENGMYCPTIKNSATNRFEKHIRLRKADMNLVNTLDKLVIQNMLTQVIMQMNNISEQISQIFVELQNDRIALVESANQQYIEAINTKDQQLRKYMLANVIKTAHDARAQLIKSFEEDFIFIEGIPDSDKNFKLAMRVANDKVHFKDFNKERKMKIQNLHKSLQSINNASGIIALAYQELDEADNIYLSLMPYKEILAELVNNQNTLKKLFDYSDIKIADIWIKRPKEILNRIETLKNEFIERNNRGVVIQLKGQELLESVGR